MIFTAISCRNNCVHGFDRLCRQLAQKASTSGLAPWQTAPDRQRKRHRVDVARPSEMAEPDGLRLAHHRTWQAGTECFHRGAQWASSRRAFERGGLLPSCRYRAQACPLAVRRQHDAARFRSWGQSPATARQAVEPVDGSTPCARGKANTAL